MLFSGGSLAPFMLMAPRAKPQRREDFRMRRLFVLALLGWLIAQGAALAASGTAVGVDKDAQAVGTTETRVLKAGADVFIGDRVVTDAKGLVQILFSDKTKLVVGPNSALLIEDYLLRDDGSVGKLAVNALAGTFRFVTGGAPKDKYQITTPTGIIGVRGTAFDFNVHDDHTTLLVIHGAVNLCNLKKQCVVIGAVCEVGKSDVAEAISLGNTDGLDRAARDAMRGMFPFAETQSRLMGAFRLEQARLCLNRPVAPTVVQDPVSESGDGIKFEQR